MMKKILKLKFGKRILNLIKQNKILTISLIVFIIFSGINTFLIYRFVQVLITI